MSALTRIQQKRFVEDDTVPDIVINSVHPGYVDTDMTSHQGPLTPEQGILLLFFHVEKNLSTSY